MKSCTNAFIERMCPSSASVQDVVHDLWGTFLKSNTWCHSWAAPPQHIVVGKAKLYILGATICRFLKLYNMVLLQSSVPFGCHTRCKI